MFPKGPSYRAWAIVFCGVSFLIANLGLNTIIAYSVPMLMFLYPLSIVLILLALLGRLFDHDRTVYGWTLGLTLAAALYDLLRSLPESVRALLHLDAPLAAVGGVLPLSSLGLGWLCPAALGLAIGLFAHFLRRKSGARA